MSLPQGQAVSISISSVSVGKLGNPFRHLRTKLQMCLANLRFLNRCNRSRITPKFISVKSNQKSAQTSRILNMAKLKLLRASIRNLRQKISTLELKLYDQHLRLSSSLHPITWDRLDSSSYFQTLTHLDAKEQILNKKFNDLSKNANLLCPPITLLTTTTSIHSSNNGNRTTPNPVTAGCGNTTASRITQSEATTKDAHVSSTSSSDTNPNIQTIANTQSSRKTALRTNKKQTANPKTTNSRTHDECHHGTTSAMKTNVHNANQLYPENPAIVNLSSSEVSQEITEILDKGLNFSVTPPRLPIEELITSVEVAVRDLPSEHQQEIRKTLKLCIEQCPPQPSNLSRSQLHNLHGLRKQNLVITRADKGGATVILDRSDYTQKVTSLLDDPSYIPIRNDPTATILRNLKKMVNTSNIIPQNEKFKLAPSTALPPRLYALPKLHKPGIPFRPIVNFINSPTYNLAKFLSNTIKTEIGNTPYHLNNSQDLIDSLKNIKLENNDILVSFDVKNLFTKTPVNESLNCLRQTLSNNLNFSPDALNDICNLTQFCTANTYFSFDQKCFKQSEGLPMGSPLSPPLCDLFMEHFEKKALNSAQFKPRQWFRYLDDVLTIWPHGIETLPIFLDHLNSINPAIQFTYEIENDRTIPFLDVLITRNSDNSLSTNVYRKPCFSASYFHSTSNHHPSQITSFVKTLAHRAHTICSEEANLTDELQYIRTLALKRQIPESLVNSIFKNVAHKIKTTSNQKTHTTLQPIPKKIKPKRAYIPFSKGISYRISKALRKYQIHTVHLPSTKIKSIAPGPLLPLPPLQNSGIYEINCECGLSYIGQTKRSVKTRISEHKRQIYGKAPVTSAIASHVISEDHNIFWQEAKIIAKPKTAFGRNIRESLEILKKPNKLLNSDNGPSNVSFWNKTLRVSKNSNSPSPPPQSLTQPFH